MTKKIAKTGELAFVLGIVLIALAVALMAKAGFGVSSIVAPAYVIFLKMQELGLDWYTFGMSEYLLQGALLILMCVIIRRFRWQYLLSFVVSVIYGFILDGWRLVIGTASVDLTEQIICFILGLICTGAAVAFIFRSYLPQQIYELFVSEVSKRYKFKVTVVKWTFDIGMLVIAIVIALLTGGVDRLLEGIGIGTVIAAVVNSFIIGFLGKLYDKVSDFSPLFPKLKKVFDSNAIH